jgi:hypothetical protein
MSDEESYPSRPSISGPERTLSAAYRSNSLAVIFYSNSLELEAYMDRERERMH